MRYVNRAAGGAAILLLLTLVLVSCNTALFGRIAHAEARSGQSTNPYLRPT